MSVLSCAFVAARQIFCELMIISHCVRYFTGGDFFSSFVLIFTNVLLFITQGEFTNFAVHCFCWVLNDMAMNMSHDNLEDALLPVF